jgi:hypothetical protein
MVWEVFKSSKSIVGVLWDSCQGDEEAPTKKTNFSWRSTRGGCNSPWRAQFLGMREREE